MLAAATLMLVLAAFLLSVALTSGAGSASVEAAAVLLQLTWRVPLCDNAAVGQPPCRIPVVSPLSQATATRASVLAPAVAAVLVDKVSIALAIALAAAPTSAKVVEAPDQDS